MDSKARVIDFPAELRRTCEMWEMREVWDIWEIWELWELWEVWARLRGAGIDTNDAHTFGTLNGSKSRADNAAGKPGIVLGPSLSTFSRNAISSNTVAIGSWGPSESALCKMRIAGRTSSSCIAIKPSDECAV